MKKLGEILHEERLTQNLTVEKVAQELKFKGELIDALETGQWSKLPEPAYVRGFIKSYANLLGIDAIRLLALYRAEFDERKYPQKQSPLSGEKRLMFTPNKLAPLLFICAVVAFVAYFLVQYLQIAKAPKLEIFSPPDDYSTTAAVIEVSGQTEEETTISINGELVPLDDSYKFYYQLPLSDGQNVIEIIASRKLAPKTKATRVVRLTR